MPGYDLLAAVVRDVSCAASVKWWIFLAAGSAMFLIALMTLNRKISEPENDE